MIPALALFALGAVLLTGLLGGAHALTFVDLDATTGLSVGIAITLVVGFIVPVALAARLRAGRKIVRPALLTLGVITTWNVALIALGLGAAPARSGDALRQHGAWPLAGHPVPAVDTALAFVADRLGAAGAPPTTSAPLTPREVYTRSADAVVIVEVQKPAPTNVLQLLLGLASGGAPEPETLMSGHGSGFFVRADGLLVTNYHVVANISRATVRLRSGERLAPVTIVVTDPAHDLALLSVGGVDHPVLPIAEAPAQVGEQVYAIGSPLGLDHTLTEGVVSALRTVQGTEMLQTQATVAPGSSGGPLLDDRGRVVGVNTATEGAGFTLAVTAANVAALLAKPLPEGVAPLPEVVVAPRVVGLDVQGLSLTPIELENTSSVLSVPLPSVARCFSGLGAGDVTIERDAWGSGFLRGTGSVRITSTLPDTTKVCLEAGLRAQAEILPLALSSTGAPNGPVTASYQIVAIDAGAEVKLPVTLRYAR